METTIVGYLGIMGLEWIQNDMSATSYTYDVCNRAKLKVVFHEMKPATALDL